MPKVSPDEIYRYAREAGFSPDQATTMTAIALAESGGNIDANATVGEDSRGLWQINVQAHGEKYGDLWDPANNARAAFAVSGGGETISPWTVTHQGRGSPYLQYQDEAQAAAVAYGDPGNLGVWTGSPGYGNTVSAGSADGAALPAGGDDDEDALPAGDDDGDGLASVIGTPGGPSAQTFVEFAVSQTGDPYDNAHGNVDLNDPDPDTFDCSELIEWAAAQAGVEVTDGSWLQYLQLKEQGTLMSVEEALRTPGALLFNFSEEPTPGGGRPSTAHAAISLGDGRTIETGSTARPVDIYDAGDPGERFKYAGYIPGLDYGGAVTTLPAENATPTVLPIDPRVEPQPTVADEPAPPPELPPLDPNSPDTDKDGLTDSLEQRYGLDSASSDTDRDNITDGYELSKYGTNPLRADTDRDGLADANEIALGLNPLDRDTDDDGKFDSDGLLVDMTDSDADGLSDELEALLQTITGDIDSDDDGSTDWLEFQAGTDPLAALDNPLSSLGVDAAQPLVTLPSGGGGSDPLGDDEDEPDLGPVDGVPSG